MVILALMKTLLPKIGLTVEVDAKQPKGRQKQQLLDTLDRDLKVSRFYPDQAYDQGKCQIRSR